VLETKQLNLCSSGVSLYYLDSEYSQPKKGWYTHQRPDPEPEGGSKYIRVLSTGAGFIGSHLVRALVRRGDSVRVIDNFNTGRSLTNNCGRC